MSAGAEARAYAVVAILSSIALVVFFYGGPPSPPPPGPNVLFQGEYTLATLNLTANPYGSYSGEYPERRTQRFRRLGYLHGGIRPGVRVYPGLRIRYRRHGTQLPIRDRVSRPAKSFEWPDKLGVRRRQR